MFPGQQRGLLAARATSSTNHVIAGATINAGSLEHTAAANRRTSLLGGWVGEAAAVSLPSRAPGGVQENSSRIFPNFPGLARWSKAAVASAAGNTRSIAMVTRPAASSGTTDRANNRRRRRRPAGC